MASLKKKIARIQRKKRIRAKIAGTATRPRFNVYRSNTNIYAQLIDDTSNITLASANDVKISKGTRTERAQKIGQKIAEIAKKQKIDTCIFDRNGYKYHGRIKALAEAAREAGLKF